MGTLVGTRHCVSEWGFTAGRKAADPFNDIELNVRFTHENGECWLVPAFWAGDDDWRVRFAPPLIGKYVYHTESSDTADAQLHGQTGNFTAEPYTGTNPLLRHGPLRISANQRHFEHADGTPFFWLADTWWMGLCHRLHYPGEFHDLTADRTRKGYSVIQIVAGLYPDMPAFDPRGANEAGFPWTENYATINSAYFDNADLRIDYLVRSGLAPCLVAAWGYHLLWLGVKRMKKHWRNLIARWGAYPVTWCLAGEGIMPYYLSADPEKDRAIQKTGWTEIARYVRQIDPWHRPVTIHPTVAGREQVEDPAVIDYEMLQTGHDDRHSLKNAVYHVDRSYGFTPHMPVINSEVSYEGIGEASRQEVQRMMFWGSVLSGAAGHTYGANGIWQLNRREQPYGPSPHGMSWGDTPWDEAAQLPGSGQLGLGKGLLERFEWWRFEPHPEWIEPHWNKENYFQPYAAGIPGEVRVMFWPSWTGLPLVKGIEPESSYRAFLWDPKNGREYPLGDVKGEANGDWKLPLRAPPLFQDWVLVLETKK